MRISAKAKYACLAVIELAKSRASGSPLRVREIAQAQGIPERYLVQILQQLKAAGFVQSARGAEGGFHLIRRADEISVVEVITCIDGPGDPPRKATSPAAQGLVALMQRAQAAEREVLASATIAQLLAPDAPRDWVV